MGDEKRRESTLPKRILAEARRAYEAGESMASIAKRLKTSRTTLIKYRDKETWTVQPSEQVSNLDSKAVRERTTAQVIDIASRRIVEQMPPEQVAAIVSDLAEHLEISRLLGQAVKQTLEQFLAGEIELPARQSTADVLNALAAGAKRSTELTRDIHGIKPGVASSSHGSEDDGTLIIEQRRIAPLVVPVNEKGRAIESA